MGKSMCSLRRQGIAFYNRHKISFADSHEILEEHSLPLPGIPLLPDRLGWGNDNAIRKLFPAYFHSVCYRAI